MNILTIAGCPYGALACSAMPRFGSLRAVGFLLAEQLKAPSRIVSHLGVHRLRLKNDNQRHKQMSAVRQELKPVEQWRCPVTMKYALAGASTIVS